MGGKEVLKVLGACAIVAISISIFAVTSNQAKITVRHTGDTVNTSVDKIFGNSKN